MLRHRFWWKGSGIALGAAGMVLAGLAAAGPAAAAPAQRATAIPAGPVTATPAPGTPQLAPTGTTQTVRQLVQCGGTMYAVGSIPQIKRDSPSYTPSNVFSFT